MPKAFHLELRRGVVAAACKGGAPLAQVATVFGICGSCPHRRLKLAGIGGVRPGATASGSAEPREPRKQDKTLEQENEILRRAAAFSAREIAPI